MYFDDLFKDININVRSVSSNVTDPYKMIRDLKKAMKVNDFDKNLGDKAYCLVDTDIDKSKNELLKKAEIEANKSDISLITSAPCFEIWLLCHYKYSTRKYSSNDEVIKELSSAISNYQKNMKGIYSLTKDKLDMAIKNAKRLEIYCEENGFRKNTVDYSPSTDVYRIIEDNYRLLS